jgi:hypothetical protein
MSALSSAGQSLAMLVPFGSVFLVTSSLAGRLPHDFHSGHGVQFACH